MPDQRIQDGVERGPSFVVTIDGEALMAYEGETLAAAMIARGIWRFRPDKSGHPRAPYCNMGVCFECLLLVAEPEPDNITNGEFRWRRTRACMTLVRPGMMVKRAWP